MLPAAALSEQLCEQRQEAGESYGGATATSKRETAQTAAANNSISQNNFQTKSALFSILPTVALNQRCAAKLGNF